MHVHAQGLHGDMRSSEFAVLMLPATGGKGIARAIETSVIRSMASSGFPMLSTSDAAHKSFGGTRLRDGLHVEPKVSSDSPSNGLSSNKEKHGQTK
mgnify:CR=1 FL=1